MVKVEVTDTFGGESNYSWVRRTELTLKDGASDRAIVRAAKAWAEWSGVRCNVTKYGDMIEIRPRGVCQVMFITFE